MLDIDELSVNICILIVLYQLVCHFPSLKKYDENIKLNVYRSLMCITFSSMGINILINHLNDIKFNIFHYDEYTDSYPYTIEDCAVSYILYYNKISFIHWVNMYHDYPYYNNDVLAIHTNMNK